MLLSCTNCAKEFKRSPSQAKKVKNHFCGRSCSISFNNIGRQRNPPKPRKQCKKILKTAEIKNLTIADIRQKKSLIDKHPSWISGYVRLYNRSWNRSLYDLPCQKCGYSLYVELAHIRAISKFPPTATLGEINDPSNILVLCPNHHWEQEHGFLLLENIPAR